MRHFSSRFACKASLRVALQLQGIPYLHALSKAYRMGLRRIAVKDYIPIHIYIYIGTTVGTLAFFMSRRTKTSWPHAPESLRWTVPT